MTRCLVLDAGAFEALAGRPGRRRLEVRAAVHAAARMRREVVVPAVILAGICLAGPLQPTSRGLCRAIDGHLLVESIKAFV